MNLSESEHPFKEAAERLLENINERERDEGGPRHRGPRG